MRRPRVVIAGASGFVGRALIPRLATRFDVVALSRATTSEAADPSGVRWQRCDLFSLRETSLALAGADYAVYLVHSMMPSARLTPGSFADIDLVIVATPIDLARVISIERPAQRVRYELQELGQPTVCDLLSAKFGPKA